MGDKRDRGDISENIAGELLAYFFYGLRLGLGLWGIWRFSISQGVEGEGVMMAEGRQ
jgi:hypothetical protein